jgi:putative glutamine amidotransferase
VAGAWQHDQRDLRGVPLHPVQLAEGSRLARAFGTTQIRTNSYHHQALDRVGQGLRVTATAGDGIVEAVEETRGSFVLGVQWHPEMAYVDYPEQRAPFDLLIQAVRQAAAVPA